MKYLNQYLSFFYLVFLVLMVNILLLYKKISRTRSFSIIKVNGHTTNILQIQNLNKNYFPCYFLGRTSLANVEPKSNESNDKVDQLRSRREKSLTPTNNVNNLEFNKLVSTVNKLGSTVNQCKCFEQLLNEHKKM
jgi:hypothetical protein